MRSSITARHTEIPVDLRQRVEEMISRLVKYAHRPQAVEVILDADHGKKVAEIIVSLPQGVVAVAQAEADDFQTALDRVAEKLKVKLDQESKKNVARRKNTPKGAA